MISAILVSDVQGAITALFALLVGHAIADFALQGDFLSIAKNRHASLQRFFGDVTPPKGVWVHALTAHSLIHAAPVWLITGSAVLAAVEVLLHWFIDFAKCEGWTSFTTDQILHVACKLLYVGILLTDIL